MYLVAFQKLSEPHNKFIGTNFLWPQQRLEQIIPLVVMATTMVKNGYFKNLFYKRHIGGLKVTKVVP